MILALSLLLTKLKNFDYFFKSVLFGFRWTARPGGARKTGRHGRKLIGYAGGCVCSWIAKLDIIHIVAVGRTVVGGYGGRGDAAVRVVIVMHAQVAVRYGGAEAVQVAAVLRIVDVIFEVHLSHLEEDDAGQETVATGLMLRSFTL